MHGTGGALLHAQLKAAGVEFVFFNPSTGSSPFFDALAEDPTMHVIEGEQEGACVAMADGYAKASGKIPFVSCARIGFPNAMTQIFNTWKDQVPMLVSCDYVGRQGLGDDGFEDSDHLETMAEPMTKWYWVARSTETLPEVTRRALKFASTPPCAPVFLAIPEDLYAEEVTTSIMDQSKFDVSMKIRPSADSIDKAARLLIEAKNPLIYLGDELTFCGAEKETLELASPFELLGLPVTRAVGRWSKPFSTQHPLYLETYIAETRYPGPADVMLNLGGRLPWSGHLRTSIKLIEIRQDSTDIARVNPT